MAAKKKTAKKKAAKTKVQEPAPQPQAPTYLCRKCGNTESVIQLRKVVVDVGWRFTQLHAIAPCTMCTKCGNTTVTVNAKIGDLAGLVPESQALPQTVDQVETEITRLEEVKAAMQKARRKRKGAARPAKKR